MFNDLVESSTAKTPSAKPWTVTVSLLAQLVVLGVLILIPLLYTKALPKAVLGVFNCPAVPPAPTPLVAHPYRTSNPPPHAPRVIFTFPTAIPLRVEMHPESAPPDFVGTTTTGVPGGEEGNSTSGATSIMFGETPQPAPPAPAPAPQRIRQSSKLQAALLISQPIPEYPPLARQARIEGDVVLHAIISKDGRVEQLSVISGQVLLVQAALDAVRQWRYQPTLLNNVPVEVDTTITVSFTLGAN
jgi:periplasmic protein TonB